MLLVVCSSGDYHARVATEDDPDRALLVESFVAVLALGQLPPEERGKSIILLVDSEPAESALTKGYSASVDMSDYERLGGVLLGRRCSSGLFGFCVARAFRRQPVGWACVFSMSWRTRVHRGEHPCRFLV